MKIKISLLALSVCALLATSSATLAQDDDSYMLRMTRLDVKIGHMTKFREALAAYNTCYTENGGEGSWSTWTNVTGQGDYYYMVSRMANYAEMGEMDEAARTCWPTAEAEVAPHLIQVETRFAKYLAPWSGEQGDSDIVELHQFRVDNGSDFRAAVGEMTTILRESDYEHMGVWYENLHNSSNQPDYFVVERFADFAAMDDDRAGAYGAIVAAAGEEKADEIWAAFRDAMTDDWGYRNEVLSRVRSLDVNTGD